ncbi:MAG TPA: glycosyltransferase family 1 protein [Burkholderiaceae bacterium]|nr:glycosyltransferase family 1 protein [Burkholderiaceae bacterium]
MTSPAPSLRHIGLSLGIIDSLSDGLGEFSTQICERVAAQAPAWREEGIRFHLHMPARWHGRFGDAVGYLATSKLQGQWHWQRGPRFAVWHGLNQLGRIGPPLFTRHSLLTIHDLNWLYLDDARARRRSMAKLRARLRKFDEVTTLTRHVEDDIRTHLDWTGPVSVVPNGARDLTAHPQEVVAGLPPDRFLLHLSRLAASKNPQSLIELAAAWPEQLIVLAGPPGPDAQRVRQQVDARGGLPNLRMVHDVSDAQKAWLYANCQAFLFPSWTEGFGLPPLEAMHFGKPVFLSDRTSLPEIGGAFAAYFPSFEGVAMRRCIETESPRLLAMSAAIRRHAATFSWDRAVQAYLAVYRRLLALDAPAS